MLLVELLFLPLFLEGMLPIVVPLMTLWYLFILLFKYRSVDHQVIYQQMASLVTLTCQIERLAL